MMQKDRIGGSGPAARRIPERAGGYDAHRSAAAAEAYVATELATTPPRRLQTVLYDSAIRTCRQAVEALDAGQVAPAAERLGRARAIILHLQGELQTQAAPDLAHELADLFREVHRRLIEADYYRKRQTVEESIQLLHHRRGAMTAFIEAAASHGARGPVRTGNWVG